MKVSLITSINDKYLNHMISLYGRSSWTIIDKLDDSRYVIEKDNIRVIAYPYNLVLEG